MNSIERMNAAALQVAQHTQAVQPQAKFIGNIAQSAAPLLGIAATFATGGAAAPLLLASKVASGISMINQMSNGGGGGGGGALQTIGNAIGPAIASNALARGDWSVAQQMMNDAYSRQNAAKDESVAQYQKLLSQYKNPAIGMLQDPHYIPMGGLQTVTAPQIQSQFQGNLNTVPSLGSAPNQYAGPQGAAYLQSLMSLFPQHLNFGGFDGSFAVPGAAAGTPAPSQSLAPSTAPHAPAPSTRTTTMDDGRGDSRFRGYFGPAMSSSPFGAMVA